jgi:hypothetical protein
MVPFVSRVTTSAFVIKRLLIVALLCALVNPEAVDGGDGKSRWETGACNAKPLRKEGLCGLVP